MKNRLTILFLVLLAITTQSCTTDTPDSYFGKTTLNVNKYSQMGATDFQRMREFHDQNALYAKVNDEFIPSDSFEAHIKTYKIFNIETDIENIKKLKPTEETKEMINASLAVFNFIKSKYETDYVKIAKLMDDKVGKEKIDTAIQKFEEQNLSKLDKKLKALFDIAMPYAKKNGMDVKFY